VFEWGLGLKTAATLCNGASKKVTIVKKGDGSSPKGDAAAKKVTPIYSAKTKKRLMK